MKKTLLIIALVLALTTSAFAGVIGVYDLTGYNDTHADFLSFLESMPDIYNMHLWMQDNFTQNYHAAAYTPYQQWIYKNGDCNDMSTFVLYYLKVHFYCSYKQVYIRCNENVAHMIAVEPHGLWYTSNQELYASFGSIADCVADWDSRTSNYSVKWYNVYDYDLNFIQSSKSPAGVPDIAPASYLE